ncbi:MAG: hypothetical protein ACI9UJ_001074 [bacterium]
MIRSLFILIIIHCSCFVYGQSAFTVKYFGLTIHPFGDPTADLQPKKLDKNAVFVRNHGVFLGYERFVYQDLVSVKVIQGVMTDCSDGLAEVSHIGIRGTLLQSDKHRLCFGIGPTLIVRESWTRFGAAYTGSGFFNERQSKRLGTIQWKFVPYAFEFEYDYCFTPKDNLSVSLTPGIPLANILSIGWKHWLNIKRFDEPQIYVPK